MAVGDAHVFPGFLTPVLTQHFLQSHRLLFSQSSAEVRGENTPERKFASKGDRTHNHQVLSPTRSPLSHPGRATNNVTNGVKHYTVDQSYNLLVPERERGRERERMMNAHAKSIGLHHSEFSASRRTILRHHSSIHHIKFYGSISM